MDRLMIGKSAAALAASCVLITLIGCSGLNVPTAGEFVNLSEGNPCFLSQQCATGLTCDSTGKCAKLRSESGGSGPTEAPGGTDDSSAPPAVETEGGTPEQAATPCDLYNYKQYSSLSLAVTSTKPAPDAVILGGTYGGQSGVYATFNKPIDVASLHVDPSSLQGESCYVIFDGGSEQFSGCYLNDDIDRTGRTLFFPIVFGAAPEDHKFTMTITPAVHDCDGRGLAAPYSWSFTLKAIEQPPGGATLPPAN